MRALLAVLVMLFVLSSSPIAEAGPHLCGTAQLRQLHPIPIQPFHGPYPGGRGAPTVGDQRDFWVYDLSVMPPKNVQVAATCRGISERVAVWIEDDKWESDIVQADVESLLASMENSTPRTPDSGIMANNELLFGAPPMVHEDAPEVTLLIYDMASYNGSAFDGLFRAEDLTPYNPACITNPNLYCSNELAMVHVNSDGIGGEYMAGVVAHEYEHLAHFGQDPYEENWLNETMAELAMVFSGYSDPGNVQAYVNNPALPLVVPDHANYGACFLFGSYLFDRLGVDGIRDLVASGSVGMSSIDEAVSPFGFDILFGEFAAANLLDDPTIEDGQFGHSLIDIPEMKSATFGSNAAQDLDIQPSALYYVELFWQMAATETYRVTFNAKGTRAQAHVVHLPTNSVWALSAGQYVELPLFDDPTLTIALANPDPLSVAGVAVAVEVIQGEYPVVEEPVVADGSGENADVIQHDYISGQMPFDAIQLDYISGQMPDDAESDGSGNTTDEPAKGCSAGSGNCASGATILIALLLGLAIFRRQRVLC